MPSNSLRTNKFLRVFKEGFWVLLGQVLAVLGALLGVRLLTDALNPTQYGEFALGMTFANLANQILFGPLSNGVARFCSPAVTGNEAESFFRAIHRLFFNFVMLTGLLALGAILVLGFLEEWEWQGIVFAAALVAIFSGLNNQINSINNALRLRTIAALHIGIESWIKAISAVGFILFFGAGSQQALFGFAMGSVVVALSQVIFFKRVKTNVCRKADEHSNVTEWGTEIGRYSLPFCVWGIFSWAHQSADRWALDLFATRTEVAEYTVLYQIGYMPSVFAIIVIIQLLNPILFQRAGVGQSAAANRFVDGILLKTSTLYILVLFLVLTIVGLGHDRIFQALVSNQYLYISHMLFLPVVAGGLVALADLVSIALMTRATTDRMLGPKILSSLGGIVFSFCGAYLAGVRGVLIGQIGFGLIYLMLITVTWRQVAKAK